MLHLNSPYLARTLYFYVFVSNLFEHPSIPSTEPKVESCICICICLNQPNPRVVPLESQPSGRSHSLYIKPLAKPAALLHVNCPSLNYKIYLSKLNYKMYFSKLKMYLSKLDNVFVQIGKYICPNWKMYLSQLQKIFVNFQV